MIELGYKLKIIIGDELNGDRLTVLEALRMNDALGFIIKEFHDGHWAKALQSTHKDVLKARHEARVNAFTPLKETTPEHEFKIVLGGK